MTESINQIDKVLLSPDQIKGQVLDHHGLMAAVHKKIKLAELIDQAMPVNKKAGTKLTNGQKGSAIILNGLGYMNGRLYMFPKFMENKPIGRLFDDSTIRAEYFNDDAIGRHLDDVKEYGVTKLFSSIAFAIGARFDLLGRTARFDTSTLSVHGEYAVDEELLKAQEAVVVLKRELSQKRLRSITLKVR